MNKSPFSPSAFVGLKKILLEIPYLNFTRSRAKYRNTIISGQTINVNIFERYKYEYTYNDTFS